MKYLRHESVIAYGLVGLTPYKIFKSTKRFVSIIFCLRSYISDGRQI